MENARMEEGWDLLITLADKPGPEIKFSRAGIWRTYRVLYTFENSWGWSTALKLIEDPRRGLRLVAKEG
jgi:hypothetical protein